jgi:PAS domain S-box-containing protein
MGGRKHSKPAGKDLAVKRARIRPARAPHAGHADVAGAAFVVLLDANGRILRWNAPFAATCRCRTDDLTGRPAHEILVAPEAADAFAAAIVQVLAGKDSATFEAPLQYGDGARRSVLWNAFAFYDTSGTARQVICTGVDVTDLRLARELAEQRHQELLHLNRLHSAGGLAAAMAHELGQPLAAVVGYCEAGAQALRSPRPDFEKLARNLDSAVTQAHRAANLIRELRGFILQRQADAERFKVEAVIAAALDMVGPRARAQRVRIEVQAEENLPPLRGRPVQIEQLLINLLNNAVESIAAEGSRGGLVRIRTRRDSELIARVSVEDTGPGLHTEVARRMFDPFLTTKPGGLGIGLMIARSIAEAHGGRLWAESAPDGGTIFHFNVPFWT